MSLPSNTVGIDNIARVDRRGVIRIFKKSDLGSRHSAGECPVRIIYTGGGLDNNSVGAAISRSDGRSHHHH